MKYLVLFSLLIVSVCEASSEREKIDHKIVAEMAVGLALFESPQHALDKHKHRLSPEEYFFLNDLIAKKLWVEMPTVKSEKNVISLTFSNKKTLQLEVSNYWTGEYALEGYKLELDNYPTVQARVAYLRRVIQNKVLKSESGHAGLFSLLINSAHAGLTCNAILSSGCLEVSMAASLWLTRTIAIDDPIARCKDNYLKNVGTAKKCMEQYQTNHTIKAVQDIGVMLASAPKTSLKITCNKSEGPTIHINDTPVARLNRGASADDYSVDSTQDPDHKLRNIPDAAIRCCKKADNDPLQGHCENFVNDNLGNVGKRKSEFKNPDIRLNGKELKGVQ